MHVGRLASVGFGFAVVLSTGCALRRMEHTGTRSIRVAVDGASVLALDVGAGYLRVQGTRSALDVRVTGTAHAATAATLDAIQITSRRSGDTIFVAGILPPSRRGGGAAATLDVMVQLPPSLTLDVTDSTGESTFRNVGPLRVRHGDGDLDIDSVGGKLDIVDGRGDMIVANVNGDVHVIDGDGSINLSNIAGSVTIPRDGSGEIQIAAVGGDVTVGSKTSGEVEARGVGGNLAISANGNGSIEYRDVKGHVAIPAARDH